MKAGDRSKTTIQWISQTTGRSKWLICLLLVLQTLQAALSVMNAFCLRRIINDAVASQKGAFISSIALFCGLIALQIAISALYRFVNDYTSSTVTNLFKGKLFTALLKGDYACVSQIHSGEWMNRLTSDVEIVSSGAVSIVPGFVGTIVRLVGALAALLWLEPLFLYILVPGGAILIGLTYVFRKVLKKMHKQIQEADGRVRVFQQERLGSLITLHAFSQEKATSEKANQLMNDHRSARMRRSNFSNLCNSGLSAAMNGTYILGVLFCGYGLIKGTMEYGTLLAVLQLVGQVQNPFANITGYLPKYYAMLASAERLIEAEQYDQMQDALADEKRMSDFYRNDFKAIGLRNAQFTYQAPVQKEEGNPDPTRVLEDFSLTVHKGEFLAFTGPSGCGKSTVLKLFMCLYSLDCGERFIETENGNTVLTGAYRQLFAYVPQENHLMTGTIREIVTFGDADKMLMEEKIHEALKTACAEDFVNELEKGIDTQLGEHGAGLSEGQMQRIAIARAVFSGHPILLLDEATSALDEDNSIQLLRNLRELTDTTVILVTHRTNHMELFDREIVFSNMEA